MSTLDKKSCSCTLYIAFAKFTLTFKTLILGLVDLVVRSLVTKFTGDVEGNFSRTVSCSEHSS